jgi:dTDP-glucose pyrophosphorylase
LNIIVESWKKLVVDLNSNINDAIKILNETGLKIVLVTNQNGKIEGTISDGDIRRGIIKGLSIHDSVNEIVHRNSLVVPPEMNRDMVIQLMLANKIQQIPIVDENRIILGLHHWDDIHSVQERSNLFVIMAGGMGTRLRPDTVDVPKPLLQISGKPMLEHIIEKAKADGFNNFVIAVNYLGNKIEDYFQDGNKFGVKISYLKENKALGTVGALSLFTSIPEEDFIVTNGDVITEISYGQFLDFHLTNNATATMAIRLHEIQNPFGVVQTKGIEIIGYEEKPVLSSNVNAGIYALNPGALSELTWNESCHMPTLFERLHAKSKSTIVYPLHENWQDIGTSLDLIKANTDKKNKSIDNGL